MAALATGEFSLTAAQHKANRLLAGQKYTLLRGGSRSGKSFVIARAIVIRALKAPNSHHAIFRFRRNSIKGSIWATVKDVLRLCFPQVAYSESLGELIIKFPNGSEIWFGGLDDKDRVDKVLGMEFATLFFNECSQMPWASVETALSRLAEKTSLKLRAFFDQNPTSKLHWSFQLFKRKLKPGTRESWPKPSELAEMQINPEDNRENISEEYFDVLEGMSAAKQKRFKLGEWSEATEGALWTADGLDRTRIDMGRLPDLVRVVVAIDPSGTAGKAESTNDDVGIVVASEGVDGRFYVLADYSCNLAPSGWARRVGEAYREWSADCIVAESNFGGAMVEAVIKAHDDTLPVKMVTASRGKIARAEPISTLHDEGRVSFVGYHEELEDQLCAMTPRGFIGEGSPDRADAVVWAISELSGKKAAQPSIRSL